MLLSDSDRASALANHGRQTILARHTCAHRVKELYTVVDEIRSSTAVTRGRTELSDSLNIAFFGSSLLSAYWNGAATYYRGIIRALDGLGHRVTFYEPDAFERQQHKDMDPPEWAQVHVYSADDTSGLYHALDKARGADVIVKASGVGVFDELLEREIPAMRRTGAMAIFWDVDAPATLDRLAQNPSDPFHAQVSRYDLVLTYGGGDPVVRGYKAAGARECIPVYNALDPQTHHPVLPDPDYMAGLSFLGNRLPDREARVEEFFLRAAAQRRKNSFCWEETAGAINRCRRTSDMSAMSERLSTTRSTARRAPS